MGEPARRFGYTSFLTLLIACALLLIARLTYLYLADPQRFPINTIKIAANYQHITRTQLETVLSHYNSDSFISLPVAQLKDDLNNLDWADNVEIERIWPDTLKITLAEKLPIAIWNHALMTDDGQLFHVSDSDLNKQMLDDALPRLSGPEPQAPDVLQNFQKLSKLLSSYGLRAVALELRNNQAWELGLANGVQLRLGKRDLEKRVMRFCKAYAAVFADKPEQLSSVDLRYAHGMAVQWKESVLQQDLK
ncbi:MAG: cell division protein FtsQ/DivIB [Legionellaceae bacterium]|nr:cell division protein FtsQ/DivIB [Legionellaceae bacterium]